jgi:hypothetical protein
MANTQRRRDYIGENGGIFIPMSVEGGGWQDNFFTTPKLLTLAGMAFGFIIMTLGANGLISLLTRLAVWFIVSSYLIRYIVFEERFYYRMYKELKLNAITTPVISWEVASIKDTKDGAIMVYSDAKVAVLVKVERDTIVGKASDFKEQHTDSLSDFYRDVVDNKYSFVQCNLMEPAGKDERLAELSKLINSSDNENLNKIMKMLVGHTKHVTNSTLYESDYILFYTRDISKTDAIIQDVNSMMLKLLDGAYSEFFILSAVEIGERVKESNGVTMFNTIDATLKMAERNGAVSLEPFAVDSIVWADNYEQRLTEIEKSKLNNITSGVLNNTMDSRSITLKKAIYRVENKNSFGIEFDSLAGNKELKEKPDKLEKSNEDTLLDF